MYIIALRRAAGIDGIDLQSYEEPKLCQEKFFSPSLSIAFYLFLTLAVSVIFLCRYRIAYAYVQIEYESDREKAYRFSRSFLPAPSLSDHIVKVFFTTWSLVFFTTWSLT